MGVYGPNEADGRVNLWWGAAELPGFILYVGPDGRFQHD